MKTSRYLMLAAATVPLLAVGGCRNDFLSGGELSTDPTRITSASPRLLFEAQQPALWVVLSGDPARLSAMWTQQLRGAQRQYQTLGQYTVTEATTGGIFASLYSGRGLLDLRKIQDSARARGDSLLLGMALVMEGARVGTAADLFGDIPYSKVFTPNAPLDKQLDVYNAVQGVLQQAITALNAAALRSKPAYLGAGNSDVVYGSDPVKWRALAYTLKARFYMHTAEVSGGGPFAANDAYAKAHAASDSGIKTQSGDYMAIYSGAANDQNLWYQFVIVQRSGYLGTSPFFIDFLTSRNDPRLNVYYNEDRTDVNPTWFGESSTGGAPTILIGAAENLLIGAESAYWLGNVAEARSLLNEELSTYRLPASIAPQAYDLPQYTGPDGPPLLQAILDEKYIELFGSFEAWNDYKRTCYPNVAPVAGSGTRQIPPRLFYDTSERNTNTSIPEPSAQPVRNANDPANASDPFGNKCLNQRAAGA